MKKITSLLLVCILILLSGCGLTVTKVESTTSANAQDITVTDNGTVTTLSFSATTAATTLTPTTAESKHHSTKKAVTKKAEPTTKMKGKEITCTIEIECKSILDNIENLRPEKKSFLPESGVILKQTTMSVADGSTVFDVIKLACKQNTCPEKCTYCNKSGIQLEYVYTPGYDSEYIRGIHQLYEKDCGTRSGWMYSVNGVFPNYGTNKFTVKNGDKIRFSYTCDLGDDVGNGFAG